MIKSFICVFLIIACFSLFSCNSKEETGRVTTEEKTISLYDGAIKSSTESSTKTISTTEVPNTIVYAFNAKYPSALTPVWVEYTPVESDELPMDDNYYYVKFSDAGANITSWYNNFGEWVKTSTKISGDSKLPDAVTKTLNDQYPGFKIEEINKENDKNMELYEIKLNKGEEKAELKVLPDGEVF